MWSFAFCNTCLPNHCIHDHSLIELFTKYFRTNYQETTFFFLCRMPMVNKIQRLKYLDSQVF